MSQYGHCHRGGQEGIDTNHHEMLELSAIMNSKYSDEYIPLPGIDMQTQANKIKEVSEDPSMDNVVYWEDESGGHGWCDRETGIVVQWG